MRSIVEINEGSLSLGLGELGGDGRYTVVTFLEGLEACDDVVDSVVDLEECV
jgi:hypothetical protein